MRQFKPYPPHRRHYILLARIVLDNKIAFYQISAEKGDIYAVTNRPIMYILIPHQKLKSTQTELGSWLPDHNSPQKCQIHACFQDFLLNSPENKIYFPKFIKAQVIIVLPTSNLAPDYRISMKQTETELCPVSAGSSQSGHHFFPPKI